MCCHRCCHAEGYLILRYRVDVHSRRPFNVDAPNLYYHDSEVEHIVCTSLVKTVLCYHKDECLLKLVSNVVKMSSYF